MPEPKVRKFVTVVEEVRHEGGPVADKPLLRGTVLAVIENPFAGSYHEEISGFMKDLEPLGLEMATRLIKSLGGDKAAIEGYGKGAIVGQGGEIEHGALWHVPGGYAMREALGNAKAIVPSTKKVGGPGTLNQALQAVRYGGEISLVGVLTGFGGEVNTGAILMKAVDLRGVYVGSVHDLAMSLRSGVRPIIDQVFAFDQADAAFDRLRAGAHHGKVAIRIGD